jgi:predicted aldo/keto reductase-like oxidoreductase
VSSDRVNDLSLPASCMLPKRDVRSGIGLSIVGLGGMAFVGMDRERASRLVEDAVACGVNYFDVAPSYGDGEAEDRLSAALQPHRRRVFLAGKTLERSANGARQDLENSLQRLGSGHFDLYQLHAVNRRSEVEEVCAPQGALEELLRAREEGLIRFLGFSSHSVPAALAMLDRFRFDTILFPVNFVCYARGHFGPQVLEKARARGTACLALKALAFTPWRKGEDRHYPNCWYRPIDDPELALAALRFSLSENVVAVLPPGDESLSRLAMRLAFQVTPLTPEERFRLMESARGIRPIMTTSRLTRYT